MDDIWNALGFLCFVVLVVAVVYGKQQANDSRRKWESQRKP